MGTNTTQNACLARNNIDKLGHHVLKSELNGKAPCICHNWKIKPITIFNHMDQ